MQENLCFPFRETIWNKTEIRMFLEIFNLMWKYEEKIERHQE